jgi:hypothetical protein
MFSSKTKSFLILTFNEFETKSKGVDTLGWFVGSACRE